MKPICEKCKYSSQHKTYIDTHYHSHKNVYLCHVLGEGPGFLYEADEAPLFCNEFKSKGG